MSKTYTANFRTNTPIPRSRRLREAWGGQVSPSLGIQSLLGDRSFFELDGNGNIKLKDEYGGLWTSGFLSAGGRSDTEPSGGATTLAELQDVYLSSLANGQLLMYDAALGKWKNVAQSTIVPNLSNYYTKAQTYNKGEVDSLISGFYRLPSGGIPATDLSSAVQASLAKANTALQSHQTLYDLVVKDSAGTAQLTYKPGVNGTYALTLTKAMVGLGNVENTKLSTWAGSTNISTLGTITTGTWQGTAIGYNYVAPHYIGRTRTTASAANATLLGITAMSNAASSGGSDKSRIEWDAQAEAWHFLGNVYADGFVSAGGKSDSGGSGGGIDALAMWKLLTNNNGLAAYDNNTKIAVAHIPSIENLANFGTRVYDATLNRTANTVLAAPNGSNGPATFRKLVAADIPSLTTAKISDIDSWVAGKGYALASSLSSYLPLAGGIMTGNITLGKNVLRFNASTDADWNIGESRNLSHLRILNTVNSSATGASGMYDVALSVKGYYGFQLACSSAENTFRMRSLSNGEFAPTEWVTLIHTGNIASQSVGAAAKLSDNAAYTVWGQTFFSGGKPVTVANTHMSGVTNIDSLLYFDTTNSRIGIGTSAPAAKLHVNNGHLRINENGNVWTNVFGFAFDICKLSTYTTGFNHGIRIRRIDASGGDVETKYLLGVMTSATINYAYLFGSSSDAVMRITTTGVGILKGTTSPAYALDVNGSIRASERVYIGTGGAYLEIVDGNVHLGGLASGKGFYTEGFVSAGGLSDTGGGSGGIDPLAMWKLLTNNNSLATYDNNTKIAVAHIPDLSATYQTKFGFNLTGTTGATYNLANFVTSSGVTSVGMTVPTGFSVSPASITSTGTFAISFASGYSLPKTAKQSEWDGKQDAISDLATIRTNASNGNTAYGWGNHASAGYAAASSLANYLPLSGGTMTADAAISWGNNDRTDWDTFPSGIRVMSSVATDSGAPTRYASGINIGTRYSFQIASAGGDSKLFYFRNNNNKVWCKLWHNQNHGASSGLDADLLDGQHGSYYATASGLTTANGNITTLQGYFTNGVANTAAKLSTVSKTAWGQTYWTSGGVPTDVTGAMTGVTSIDSLLHFDTTTARIGIGTSAPAAKLHVNNGHLRINENGNVWTNVFGNAIDICKLSTYTTGYNHGIRIRRIDASGGDVESKYLLGVMTGATISYAYLYGSSSDAVMRITTTGVGILKGNTNPAYALDVTGTGRFTSSLTASTISLTNNSGVAHLAFGRGGANYITAPSGGGLYFVTGGKAVSGANSSLVLSSDGKVGVLTAIPAYELDVTGVIHATTGIFADGYVSAGGLSTTSDARMKENLSPVALSVRDIAAAPAVSFTWKNGGGQSAGSIAQYWQKHLPMLVQGTDMLTMQYGNIALIAAIKVAQEVETHAEKIRRLERTVAAQEVEINRLRALIS